MIIVTVVASVATPTIGSAYFLTCSITGAERLTNLVVSYQWYFQDEFLILDQIMETLSFSSLIFSDAGNFTCLATIMSPLLNATITAYSSNSVDIRLTCTLLFSLLIPYMYLCFTCNIHKIRE